jgi:hypothetical protein
MFLIEGVNKRCSQCREIKSLTEFHKRKNSSDGLNSSCKDCQRIRHQEQKERPKELVEKKQCLKCKEVKPREEYTKDIHKRDGLASQCKKCDALSRQARIKQNPALPETKRCSQCGITKPQQEFDRKRESKDGLCSYCKGCRKLNMRVLYIMRSLHTDKEKGLRPGIENWDQTESAIREMAELQIAINDTKIKYDNDIKSIKQNCAEKIKPYLCKQGLLQLTIEDFIKKTCRSAKRMVKKTPFGMITFYRRRLEIALDIEVARARMGLP